jgi:hypothetical protein
MNDTVFDKKPELKEISIDPTKNYVEDLVGEGKKYATVEDLARSRLEADNFIERLKHETTGLRDDLSQAVEELNKRASIEDFMDQMKDSYRDDVSNDHEDDRESASNSGSAMSAEDIDRLVDERLTHRERQRTEQANIQAVKRKFEETFGSDYQSEVLRRAKDAGVDTNTIDSLAKTNPQAVFKLLDVEKVDQAPRNNGAPSLFSSGPSIGAGTPQKEPWARMADFTELRRKNPTEYWSPRTQNRMHEMAHKHGEAFFEN